MLARLVLVLLAAAAVQFAPAAAAQKFQSGSNYICPNNSDTGLNCYLDAVIHLYTMCRHVKSIEIIEFGLPGAQEGVNGAKSEYCVDKQKLNIVRPYQAALKEATGYRDAVDGLRTLQQYWLDSMARLKWHNGEPRDTYEDRVMRAYDELSCKIDSVRVAFSTAPDASGPPSPRSREEPGAKAGAKPAKAAKSN